MKSSMLGSQEFLFHVARNCKRRLFFFRFFRVRRIMLNKYACCIYMSSSRVKMNARDSSSNKSRPHFPGGESDGRQALPVTEHFNKGGRQEADGKGGGENNMGWISRALLSAALFVMGALSLMKGRQNRNDYPHDEPYKSSSRKNGARNDVSGVGVSAAFVMAFVSALVAAAILVFSATFRRIFAESVGTGSGARHVLPWLLLFGVLFFFGNIFYFGALTSAPNAGYAQALSTLQIVALTFLSSWLFGQSNNATQVCGVLLVTTGAILISI